MREMKKLFFLTILIMAGAAAPALALGTASDTALVPAASVDLYNYATYTVGSTLTQSVTATQTVRAVYGLATATFTEEAAKSAAAGATATYDFAIQYVGNATETVYADLGAQSFGGAAGTTTEWSVAAEHTGVGMVSFVTSGGATAAQAGDSAPLSGIAPGATAAVRLYHKTAADATDGGSSSFTVSLRVTAYPGAPYTGFNGVVYGGATTWSRQLDSGTVITTVNGVVINATKTLAVVAPAAYVSAGGGAADAVPGALLNYTLTFANNGGQAANTVIVTDALPASVTYVPGSIKSCFTGAACAPMADPDADGADPDCYASGAPVTQIICNAATLSAGGGGQVTYSVTID
jgi:uncharacterized repeat protein (TIGR01451 family)